MAIAKSVPTFFFVERLDVVGLEPRRAAPLLPLVDRDESFGLAAPFVDLNRFQISNIIQSLRII